MSANCAALDAAAIEAGSAKPRQFGSLTRAPTGPINVPWIEIAILEWRRRFQMLIGATKNEASDGAHQE
jgi:hypothetical protein